MTIVDAHLDLAFNGLNGRDVLLPAAEQPTNEDGIASVGLPDLLRGNVRLVCGTIFCEPADWKSSGKGYTNAEEAHAIALAQHRWYLQRSAAFRMVRRASDLDHLPENQVSTILLMEGADPLRTPADVQPWFERGMRMIGLAWKKTRYAGGTGAPGPLTTEGVELVSELDRFGIIHDASHLAEESFWQLMKISDAPVAASHSNCRAIVPTDRQLSDEMIRAIVDRGGVIGINFFEKFLLAPDEYQKRPATLADFIRHVRHICDLAGNARHVGIGTDMDGGFGRDQIPREIKDSGDLPAIGPALRAAGFSEDETDGILGANWLRFFRRSLPP